MKKTFKFSSIDWEGQGYFGCPSIDARDITSKLSLDNPWLSWLALFEQAKQGDFANLSFLLDLYNQSDSPVFRRTCAILLGDAASFSDLEVLTDELRSPTEPDDYEAMIDYCNIISARGRLADVPLLSSVYIEYAEIEDADIIPVYISNLLEPEPGDISDPSELSSLGDFKAIVLNRYNELAKFFGTDQVLVYGGEQFSVRRLASMILSAASESYFPMDYRRKFEASTGINCSHFYKGGSFQPLAASAIAEAFLDSLEADRYEDGVRYFFGHRIPN